MRSLTFIFSCCLTALLICSLTAQAQLRETWGRVWTLNEGATDKRGSVGFIDLPCAEYSHFDSIPAFSTDLRVMRGKVLVAGSDSLLHVYGREASDVASHKLHIRKFDLLEIPGGYLLVASCLIPPFVRVYGTDQDFSAFDTLWESSLEEAPNETEAVAVNQRLRKAYVSMNGFNGFGINGVTDNRILVLDLNSSVRLLSHINVAANPNALISVQGESETRPGSLYVQSLDYGTEGLTVTKINADADTVQRVYPTGHFSFGGFALDTGVLFTYYNPSTFTTLGLARLDLASGEVDTLQAGSFTGASYDDSFDYLALNETDYATTGALTLIDEEGGSARFATHVSPSVVRYQYVGSPTSSISMPSPRCPDLVTFFSHRLSGPLAGFEWNDGHPNLDRNFETAGAYALEYRLTEGCAFTLSFTIREVTERPAFEFTTPDTIDLPEMLVVIQLSGRLSDHAGARWIVSDPLLLNSAENLDTVEVAITSPRTGWYYFSVEVSVGRCRFLFEDSVFVRTSVSRHSNDVGGFSMLPYPNPTYAQSFSLASPECLVLQELTLLDLRGRVIHRWTGEEARSESYKLSGTAPGTYILKATMTDGRISNAKLIVD